MLKCKDCPFYVYDYDFDFEMERWHCTCEDDESAPCHYNEDGEYSPR